MFTKKTVMQAFKVISVEDKFEIRYYDAAKMAMIVSTAKTYHDLGNRGFGQLSKYIFGGNKEKKQIAMTSPVHMDIGDSRSTMAFVLPAVYNHNDLPIPNDSKIMIVNAAPEYVAVIQFAGFANDESIQQHKVILENALKEKGISYYGNFRFLGYNPPFQLFGRRNEVIVALNADKFN